jgi:hypothetical protein
MNGFVRDQSDSLWLYRPYGTNELMNWRLLVLYWIVKGVQQVLYNCNRYNATFYVMQSKDAGVHAWTFFCFSSLLPYSHDVRAQSPSLTVHVMYCRFKIFNFLCWHLTRSTGVLYGVQCSTFHATTTTWTTVLYSIILLLYYCIFYYDSFVQSEEETWR